MNVINQALTTTNLGLYSGPEALDIVRRFAKGIKKHSPIPIKLHQAQQVVAEVYAEHNWQSLQKSLQCGWISLHNFFRSSHKVFIDEEYNLLWDQINKLSVILKIELEAAQTLLARTYGFTSWNDIESERMPFISDGQKALIKIQHQQSEVSINIFDNYNHNAIIAGGDQDFRINLSMVLGQSVINEGGITYFITENYCSRLRYWVEINKGVYIAPTRRSLYSVDPIGAGPYYEDLVQDQLLDWVTALIYRFISKDYRSCDHKIRHEIYSLLKTHNDISTFIDACITRFTLKFPDTRLDTSGLNHFSSRGCFAPILNKAVPPAVNVLPRLVVFDLSSFKHEPDMKYVYLISLLQQFSQTAEDWVSCGKNKFCIINGFEHTLSSRTAIAKFIEKLLIRTRKQQAALLFSHPYLVHRMNDKYRKMLYDKVGWRFIGSHSDLSPDDLLRNFDVPREYAQAVCDLQPGTANQEELIVYKKSGNVFKRGMIELH